MLKNNQGFVCKGCGKTIPQAVRTCRNHCPYCFLSMHVDVVPGDRKSDCQSKMIPTQYVVKNGTIKIQFTCVSCGHIHNNKIAPDDNVSELDNAIKFRAEKYPLVALQE